MGSGGRRRRADAERSIAAILDAAVKVLNERPEASMAEIARAAGLTRQTVYAHYSSREELLQAVIERETAGAVAALEAARLGEGPPEEALRRLLDVTWDAALQLVRVPLPRVSAEEEYELHRPILEPVEKLIRRGQRAGAFDRRLKPAWLGAVFIMLSHTAAEELAAGRLSPAEARRAREQSILRVFGVEP